ASSTTAATAGTANRSRSAWTGRTSFATYGWRRGSATRRRDFRNSIRATGAGDRTGKRNSRRFDATRRSDLASPARLRLRLALLVELREVGLEFGDPRLRLFSRRFLDLDDQLARALKQALDEGRVLGRSRLHQR